MNGQHNEAMKRALFAVKQNELTGVVQIDGIIKTGYEWCFTYEPDQECQGASGRKLRQDCVYCPCYTTNKTKEKKEHEKSN